MAKQIKVGFDKIPSPELNQFVPLYDLGSGTPLTDISGRIIVTEEPGLLTNFILSDNAMSVHLNNEAGNQNVGIIEQFPIESEVSSTLLGVPRAEEQLSLFSDVSTYGLDDDNWEYFTYTDGSTSRLEWNTRRHPFYGERKGIEFVEYTNEQALALEAFPVNYTFPFGPRYVYNYNENLFERYLNFIVIGKALHSYFTARGFGGFADTNFISDRIQVLDSSDNEINIDENSIDSSGTIILADLYDVSYGNDITIAFEEVERFTLTYKELINRTLLTPIEAFYNTGLFRGISNLADETRPGYSDSNFYFGVLESKSEFRYQPGRISGFTYGIRLRNDPNSTSSFIEFGCVNDTDQYVFRIEGSRFSIVRRSAVSLFQGNPELQQRLGFTANDESFVFPPGINNPNRLYELEIPRERFNGDPLDGNGDSGYILSFEDVTMFKIEFGWYGAIGAKFYAYVPFGNDGARWVLMHTLVIENGLGKPCLVNPNFKFRYALGITNTAEILEPLYVYKYGSSYYIDGGDEGTLRINSKASDRKTFSAGTPTIGVLPKNVMLNRDGIEIDNRMKVFPSALSVSSDAVARIDVKEIIGSPEGHHFHYSPSLKQSEVGDKGRTVTVTLSTNRDRLTLAQEDGNFLETDVGAKVIADGLYNCYIGSIDPSDNTTAIIERRGGNYNLTTNPISDLVRLSDGSEIDPAEQTFTARLSNYDTIAASNIPITTDFFKIHFLNPTAGDAFSHRADFAVAVTPKEPRVVLDANTGTQELKFGTANEDFDLYDTTTTYVEWTNNQVSRNTLTGAEVGDAESGAGTRFDLDIRLPRPAGEDSGIISGIIGRVETLSYNVTDVQVDPGGLQRLYFASLGGTPDVGANRIGIAEIGVNGTGTGITIESLPQTEVIGGISFFYILVNGDVEAVSGYNNAVQLKRVLLTDNFRLVSRTENGSLRFDYKQVQVSSIQEFNVKPLYLTIAMKDRSAVHNIVVEEISKQTAYTHSPNWIFNDSDATAFVGSGGSTRVDTPSNFIDEERLSSVRFDVQTKQPLRPGNTVYSFFADANQTELIDLSNIFGADRKVIRSGNLNNLATFFVATPVEINAGNIEASITLKEQQ